ncbi:phosphoribosyl 1,2-cyclic phosphate phosphodiesterase [Filimonas lacunae]|uniref:Phosphoribosyl 1,2-cyclic phosphate phosphodiesterase n=1 Tax=Filimonas lacunae TaxID=477680 RepID=A0A173MN59_9BACT|nr:MBL fold metallo-hydrolase [Filimonas lacunae]BAV09074.1 metal-dependent hydrolases of the beta-lactamase superfamily I [Filimonas lacunae]SIS66908.1 phosphoribosyl 1,2-cyclic phosphate phosphodiesterase [Filimonas lacunae]
MSPSLRITFLGTGTSSGVPMIGCHCPVCTSADAKDKRLRSSVLVETPATTFVIDTTPDFREQMLRIGNEKLDAVLFTHPHKDHTAGLDDIRPYNFFQQKAMEVYANAMTINQLKVEFAYVFAEHKYPGIPDINLHEIDLTPFTIADVTITPILVWHHKLPVYGFRIGDFTYITDANRIDDAEKEKIKGSSVLVVNALRREQHISHFTLDEAVALTEELHIPKAYFTHISHQLGTHVAVEEELPAHIRLAYDGLVVEL